MKFKKEIGFLAIVMLMGTVYDFTDYKKTTDLKKIPEELLFRNNLGDYYKLISIKGNSHGVLEEDTTVSFIYKKIDTKKVKQKKYDLTTIRENMYRGGLPLKNLSKSDPRGNLTSQIVKELSGRLLFGTRGM